MSQLVDNFVRAPIRRAKTHALGTMTSSVRALGDAIRVHPWRTIGIATAAGATVAATRSRDPLIRNAARAAITIAVALVREIAIESVITRARSWIDAPERCVVDDELGRSG